MPVWYGVRMGRCRSEVDAVTVIRQLREAGVEVYTRRQWGSEQQKAGAYARRRQTHPMFVKQARYGFLHITVTSDTDTVREGADGMRQIETYGYSDPPMVSYQWCTTNEGKVFQGQSLGVKGTHTVNDKNVPGYPDDLNGYGYAVALLQNVGDPVTDVQVTVTAMVFAAMKIDGKMERGAPILPHRMFAAKACPGDLAMARLDDIRDAHWDMVRRGSLLAEPKPTRVSEGRGMIEDGLILLDAAVKKGKRGKHVVEMRNEIRAALEDGPLR